MSFLTPLDRLYILVGCGMIILVTTLLMACKILPFCWLHRFCPWDKEEEEDGVDNKKKIHKHHQHQQHQLVNYGGTDNAPTISTIVTKPSITNTDGLNEPGFAPFAQPAWLKPDQESDFRLSAYNSIRGKRRSLWRSRLPPLPATGNVSMTDVSEAEPSPAGLNRRGSCFSKLTDEKDSFRGMLDVIVHYSLPEERLMVVVKNARSLPLNFYGTANDVYIKTLLIRDQRRRWRTGSSNVTIDEIQSDRSDNFAVTEFETKLVRRSANPVFGDQFVGPLKDRDRKYASLKFVAFSSDRFSHQSMSGETNLSLRKLDLTQRREFALRMHAMEQNLGDIFMSLSYLPTAERLSVSVFKCVGLQNIKEESDPLNPYIRATTLLRTKTLEKHKVQPQLNTKNPVFNAILAFNLRPDDLDRIVLVIAVCHRDVAVQVSPSDSSPSGDSLTVEAVPRSSSTPPSGKGNPLHRSRRKSMGNAPDAHDRNNSPSLLKGSHSSLYPKSKSSNSIRSGAAVVGRVAFGANTGGETQAHWLEAVRNPRNQFSRWHKLES